MSLASQISSKHSPRPQHACIHVSFSKNEETMHSIRTIVAYSLRFRNRRFFKNFDKHHNTNPILSKLDLDKLPTPKCHKCHDTCGRLHACIHCVFIGCHREGHIQQHLKERNHSLALDFDGYTVFCYKCNDYVYDWEFEEIINYEKVRMNELLSLLNDPHQTISRYEVWKPSPSELDLMREKSRVTSHLGLRGLRNLGNTCFMNVIIQCLVHNPPLRAFFLSDKHNSKMCLAKDKLKCTACQMDRLFAQFYSGEMTPLIPNEFLWSIWTSCKELVGYAQQDAHEFFISVINNIHSSLAVESGSVSLSSSPSNSSSPCCIVHSIFGGMFQSAVRCLDCGNCTLTNDPFVDISLDVRPVFSPISASPNPSNSAVRLTGALSKPLSNSSRVSTSLTGKKRNAKNSSSNSLVSIDTKNVQVGKEIHTLTECLDVFTHEERLGKTDYKCSICSNQKEGSQGAVKQLSLKKLPLVLAFQLKRYDHRSLLALANANSSGLATSSNDNGGKLDMIVKFPLELDMTRWTTKRVQKLKEETNIPNPGYQYTLFAVIVHIGTLQSGHYVCYVKQSGSASRWFRFDDHHVTMAEWEEVCQSEAYMLFYIKNSFEYEK